MLCIWQAKKETSQIQRQHMQYHMRYHVAISHAISYAISRRDITCYVYDDITYKVCDITCDMDTYMWYHLPSMWYHIRYRISWWYWMWYHMRYRKKVRYRIWYRHFSHLEPKKDTSWPMRYHMFYTISYAISHVISSYSLFYVISHEISRVISPNFPTLTQKQTLVDQKNRR